MIRPGHTNAVFAFVQTLEAGRRRGRARRRRSPEPISLLEASFRYFRRG